MRDTITKDYSADQNLHFVLQVNYSGSLIPSKNMLKDLTSGCELITFNKVLMWKFLPDWRFVYEIRGISYFTQYLSIDSPVPCRRL